MSKGAVNMTSYAALVALMLDGEHTAAELAEISGVHYQTALKFANALHNAEAAHVCRLDPDTTGRMTVKVFKIGKGKDAAKRAPLTSAQRKQASRDRAAIRAQWEKSSLDDLTRTDKTK